MGRLLLPFVLLVVLVGASVVSDRPLPRADLVMYNGSDVNTLDPQRKQRRRRYSRWWR